MEVKVKNFQVRLPDRLHSAVAGLAAEREISIADIIRESLELHILLGDHFKNGSRIFAENVRGERSEILILGISHDRDRRMERAADDVDPRVDESCGYLGGGGYA